MCGLTFRLLSQAKFLVIIGIVIYSVSLICSQGCTYILENPYFTLVGWEIVIWGNNVKGNKRRKKYEREGRGKKRTDKRGKLKIRSNLYTKGVA